MPSKTLSGKVISNRMQKTVVVAVETSMQHPIYKKVVSRRKKYVAHTENSHNVGDLVEIKESRPLSKTKRWTVVGALASEQQDLARG